MPTGSRTKQFSLRSLLLMTTIIAILLGGASAWNRHAKAEAERKELIRALIYGPKSKVPFAATVPNPSLPAPLPPDTLN
jgi:hypothetical protein